MSNLIPIEFKNQRVITTKLLAQQFGTEENNIKVNFNNNKERFIEGKHFYKLEGAELAEFKNRVNDINLVGKNANQLILWTERGAARHAKILDTDEAWLKKKKINMEVYICTFFRRTKTLFTKLEHFT